MSFMLPSDPGRSLRAALYSPFTVLGAAALCAMLVAAALLRG